MAVGHTLMGNLRVELKCKTSMSFRCAFCPLVWFRFVEGEGSAALQLSSAVHFYSDDEQQAQHSMLCLCKATVGTLWRLCKIPFKCSLHHLCHCEIPKLISVVILRKMQHRSQGSWKGQAAAQHDCWAWNWQHWGVFSAPVIIQVD